MQLIADQDQPAIARASALALLCRAMPHPHPRPRSRRQSPTRARSFAPLCRARFRQRPRLPWFKRSLLCSAIRSARFASKRRGHLPASDQRSMTPEQQTAFAAAYLELFDAEMIDADRPEAHLESRPVGDKARSPCRGREAISDGIAPRSKLYARARQSRRSRPNARA